MCETKNCMFLSKYKQLFHLFLKLQGIRVFDLKASTTREDQAQAVIASSLNQLLAVAISISLIASDSSAWKALPGPVFPAKQSTKSDCFNKSGHYIGSHRDYQIAVVSCASQPRIVVFLFEEEISSTFKNCYKPFEIPNVPKLKIECLTLELLKMLQNCFRFF